MQSPESLTALQISELLDKADVIETWLKAVRAYAQELIEAGDHVPGWKLVPKRGTRKWKDERIVKQRFASEGLQDFIVEELVSPAQAERLAKKQGVQLDLFDLITSESSGVNLTRETDKQASAAASVKHDFAD
jgi:Protein of unknown function (DUF2800)